VVSSADLSSLRISREQSASSGARPSRRLLFWILGVLTVAALIGAAVVLSSDRAIPVRTAAAAVRGGTGGAAGGLTANGYVVARTKASVSSKMPGRLTFLGVEEGDRVAAGAVIARLEATEYEATVRQAAADVLAAEALRHEADAQAIQARRALARARALRAESLIAEQTLEDAASALEMAEARVQATAARTGAAREGHAAARASLDNAVIRAPFAGTILRKDAEVGEVVAPAVAGGGLTRGAVVTMADLTTLEVEVDVNEAYISGIRREQTAEIVLDAYPTETFRGHVRQLVPTADRQKATVLVRVAIDSRDPRIMPEMGARVVFAASQAAPGAAAALPPRVFVPAGAVRSEGGKDIVWVVTDGKARRRQIEAGPVMGEERQIRSGLSGGEQLILDPPATLTDGATVKVQPNR
jgi:RND family efflux transporter MFP subunit